MQRKGGGGAKEGLEEEDSSSDEDDEEGDGGEEEEEEEDVLASRTEGGAVATGDELQEPKQLRKLRSRAKRVLAGIEADEEEAESGKASRKGLMGCGVAPPSPLAPKCRASQGSPPLTRSRWCPRHQPQIHAAVA